MWCRFIPNWISGISPSWPTGHVIADPSATGEILSQLAVREARGAKDVAGTLRGRARAARSAFANGTVGAVWMRGGQPKVVFWFTIEDGKIVSITLIAD